MNNSPVLTQQNIKGWKQAYLPVVCGDAPAGTIPLSALADPARLALLTPFIAANLGTTQRQAALTLIHFGVGVATETLIAPLVLDGMTLKARANQLGFVLGEDGALFEFWVAPDIWIHLGVHQTSLGRNFTHLIKPIVECIAISEKLGSRGLFLLLYDAIERGCRRLENANPNHLQAGWIEELMAGIGDSGRKMHKTFTICPDNGPQIEMAIPRVCCVLSHNATDHSCPTCPQHPDDETRRQLTEAWLRSLDDEGFRAETGRERVRT
jgi:hypothetical protein